MTPLEVISQTLTESLQLSRPPLAIAFQREVPEGVAIYAGQAPAGCRFWQEAAHRVFATVPRDHELCAIGLYTHGMEISAGTQTDLQNALKVFGDLGYVRPEDMPFIPVLKHPSKVVVYGPLALIPVPPDVVLLFVRADQALILSEASQQLEDGLPPALGRPACGIVPYAINNNRTVLSLGCCGARAYLDEMTPDVALYAVPASKLEAFTERVAALAIANAVLTKFHTMRRLDIEAGNRPSVTESLHAMG